MFRAEMADERRTQADGGHRFQFWCGPRSGLALAPGKRTLTEALEPGPRFGGGEARAVGPGGPLRGPAVPPLATGSSRRAPPTRVADSTEGEPNAVLRVLVYNGAGEVLQRWESKGRWEGGLPQKYTATRGGKGWSWDNTGGSTIRVDTNKDGRGGLSGEAWAKAAAKRIVVYAYVASDVTFDEDAKESDKAPGHARDPGAGGDGSTTRVNPGGKETGTGDSKSRDDGAQGAGNHEGKQGGDRKGRHGGEQGAGNQEGKEDGRKQGVDGNETEEETETELGTEEGERIADMFERDLDIDPNDEDLEDETTTGAKRGGTKPGGEGTAGGDPDGRTGDDTRTGGTGPGGDKARPDGHGKGSEARRAAVKETKAAIKAIKADKVKGPIWNAAAELAEEATDVMPVAGRLPQNHDYAGQAFPSHLLPEKYRSKGLRFTKEGYPDFAPHARQLPNGKNHVEIEYTGSRKADFAAANKKAKLDQTPKGWTWHHAEDMKTMYLVPDKLHDAVKHSGGVARYKHGSGVPRYGD
jgi:hypothetical protein